VLPQNAAAERGELNNGRYRTDAGSTVEISGKYSGISVVDFDWLEEGACIDCAVNVYPNSDGYLTWTCEKCGGGRALLKGDGSHHDA
jgi:hypothetical protein